MSVAPIKKVEILTYRQHASAATQVLQRLGVFEVLANKDDNKNISNDSKDEAATYRVLLPRVQQGIRFLETYEPKQTLWRMLRDGTSIQITEEQVERHLKNVEVLSPVIDDIEELHAQCTKVFEELKVLREEESLLKAWEKLSIPIAELSTTATKTYLLEQSSTHATETSLSSEIEKELTKYEDILAEVVSISHKQCAVTVHANDISDITIQAICGNLGVDEVTLPTKYQATTKEAREEVKTTIKQLEETEAGIHAAAEAMARDHLRDLRIKYDVLSWRLERDSVMDTLPKTESTAVFVGWLYTKKQIAVERKLEEAGVLYAINELEWEEGEVPPVELTNSALVQPFEVVTRLYGMPGHRDLDPTPFLAAFFFLFFGLSLTDVGYGIILMTVSILILFVFTVAPPVRLFGKLLFFMGLASTLVGLLFGGYLGIDPQTLPASLQAIQQFDPIGNPLPVFYLALALGVFQVMVGLVLKIFSEARNGNLLGGALDQGPWLVLFVALICFGLASYDVAFVYYAQQFLFLVYGSIAAIVITSARHGETILQMIQKSLLSLYDSIGYFSDILSYSRLLALGLATTALAFAVNLIAEIVQDSVPYVGVVFAIIVLIIGHIFTLAVNTLGAFIHSARLQFVEFFGKFISGTGRLFRPFARRGTYTTIITDE